MTWRRCLFCAVSLLLSGCTLIPTVPALPTPLRAPEIGSVADALQAMLSGEIPPSVLTLRYEIGNPHWDGQAVLTVGGSGAVEVSFERGAQFDTWQATLSEDQVLALVQLLADNQVWAIRGQRETGVPDEAYPTLTVEVEGLSPLEVGMWHGEALDHPNFGPIVEALAGLASEVSGGVAK